MKAKPGKYRGLDGKIFEIDINGRRLVPKEAVESPLPQDQQGNDGQQLFDDISAERSSSTVDATTVYNELVDVDCMVGMAVLLPILRSLNSLVKACQQSDISVQVGKMLIFSTLATDVLYPIIQVTI